MLKWLSLIVVASTLALSCGCKKNSAGSTANVQTEAIAAAQGLPDGTNVLAALDRKEYDTAVATLTKIQQSLADANQESQFMTLKQHVRGVLIEAATTDPKANDALNGLRMLTQGR